MTGRQPRLLQRAGPGVVLMALLIAACDTTPNPPSVGPLGSGGPVGSAAPNGSAPPMATSEATVPEPPVVATVFDGLYAGSEVSVSGDATVAVVRSALACPALEHLIGAGEWTITGRRAVENGSPVGVLDLTLLTLENGKETALAYLSGNDSCTARLARTTKAALRLAGAATFDGTATLDLPLCITIGKDVALGATYRTPGGPNLQLSVVAPARTGSTRLDVEDVQVSVSPGSMSLEQLAGVLIEAFQDPEKGRFADSYVPSETSRARIEVESVQPFVGTLHLTDFEGADGAMSVDAQVACRLPGGSLRRAAELAGGPAPTSSPGAAGSSLPPFNGAAPATAVITQHQIAGTYQLPASKLDCFYDVDQGAWTIQTLGGDDPTFYLYAFTGPGGGSTSRVAMGLIVGDGGDGALLLFDTTVAPPDGTAEATIAAGNGQVSLVVQGTSSGGATLAANLSCPAA